MMRVLSADEVAFVAGGEEMYPDMNDGDSDGGGYVDSGTYDGGDVVVTASSDDTDDANGGSNNATSKEIVVTAPRGSDPNYEVSVPSNTQFACPIGNTFLFGNYGTPKGTLGAGTHVTLTPAAYNKVSKGCVFNSGSGNYRISAQ